MLLKVHVRPSGFTDGKSKDFDLNISADSSVGDVKEKIQAEQNIPANIVSLLGWSGNAHQHLDGDQHLVRTVIKELSASERHHLIVNVIENEENVSKGSERWINSGKGNADSHRSK